MHKWIQSITWPSQLELGIKTHMVCMIMTPLINKEIKFVGQNSFIIVRKRNGNWFFATSSSANGSPLLSVVQIDGKYYIDNWFQKKTQNWYSDFKNTNWIPVKYLNQDFPFKSCHKLSVGDVIKFGRLVFQVLSLKMWNLIINKFIFCN